MSKVKYGDIEISDDALKPYTEHLIDPADPRTKNVRNRNDYMRKYMEQRRMNGTTTYTKEQRAEQQRVYRARLKEGLK